MQKFTGLVIAGLLLAVSAGTAMAASPAAAGASTAAPAASSTSTPASGRPHHAMMHGKHVRAIQAALNQNGEQLTVDGVWGPKTRSALTDFQQKNGLKATGHADKATLQKLNITM